MSTFTLHHRHPSGARRGTVHTAHGDIATPFFMPIATKGNVKSVLPWLVWQLQRAVDSTTTPILLANTFHLSLAPGAERLTQAGGLHGLMPWAGPLLTDSGGYQVFSLARLRKKTSSSVTFRSPRDGSLQMLSPQISMELQAAIGADIWMAFDYFPGFPATHAEAAAGVQQTTAWAQECRTWFDRFPQAKEHQLFGIIQGSTFPDLRAQSCAEILACDFDGYALGGLAVGEPSEEMLAVVRATTPLLPENRPRYLMGVGLPRQMLAAVRAGIDMFDCVIPTRNARHGLLFCQQGARIISPDLDDVLYQTIRIRAAVFRDDFGPISAWCGCPVCQHGLSRAALHHLFLMADSAAASAATMHNLWFMLQFMKEIRQQISDFFRPKKYEAPRTSHGT